MGTTNIPSTPEQKLRDKRRRQKKKRLKRKQECQESRPDGRALNGNRDAETIYNDRSNIVPRNPPKQY
jgi:hypothetical protein